MVPLSSSKMTNGAEDQSSNVTSGGFHTVQPLRDLESNWGVDLAKNLEEYLLKICSGEISGNDDGHLSVNFAEAALLLQGSIQVYSRKVEYLYNLVLHALDFISEKRQQDQPESTSAQPEESSSNTVTDEDDLFWVSNDIPVEAKICLDNATGKDVPLNHFVKPPANLIVLEGDCFDTTGDGGELESYLLATNDLYRDFILLDPCDALAVDDFLEGDIAGKGQNGAYRGSYLNSKSHKSFQYSAKRPGGSSKKSSHRKNPDVNLNPSPSVNHGFDHNDLNMRPDPPALDTPANNNCGVDVDDGYSEHLDDSDDDSDDNDPWKPLNPHEPGNLKVKPYKKVNASKRPGLNPIKRISVATQFPPAKLHGTISPDLMEMWEKQCQACERQWKSQSPPPYEKLRASLVYGERESGEAFCNPDFDIEDNGYDSDIPDFGQPNDDMPHNMMDEDVSPNKEKEDDGAVHFDTDGGYEQKDPHSLASLEDLCRSHLDALLASIAETEKQTELAARVSTWKQKIEHNLEEQESRPPFDIHAYGERIVDKLSLDADSGNVFPFGDVVAGQEKHDVARSFSALLQLVNDGDIDLDRDGANNESICYTAVNPFHVRLIRHEKRPKELQLRSSKKRPKSPTNKEGTKGQRDKSQTEQVNGKFPVKIGKFGGIRCTPEGKRRRRSRLVEAVDLHSTG